MGFSVVFGAYFDLPLDMLFLEFVGFCSIDV